uniref:Poly(3-hydroxyalkanoate) depolymerase n=1 Tax=Paucimonas lemoignei TaxID=29443 RepID=Q9L7K1_PAULE|nr:poly(3-hydroxyalkanoate) depolymerase [Paucimonas lemoignei]
MQVNKMTQRAATALIATLASTAAFALTPGSGAWVKESATYGTPNLQDAYVYVPSNANLRSSMQRALMLSLHGCGQTASGNVTNKKFNWESVAEQYGMVVIAPTVPSGTSSTRTSSGCWDWFGANHNRTSRDAVPLIKLIDAVKARANLDIDPNQIYISGLSSGAAETHVLGCSFPDYFAGVVPNAAPALGSASTDIFSDPVRTAQQVADTCKAINGNQYNSYFNTQIFANVYGSNDAIVKPSHNVRNRDGMKILYGANTSGGTVTVSGGGTADIWKDANGKVRISNMVVSGMSHAWPAGSGGSGGGTYVDYTHVNYPSYIVPWIFANNLRVGGGGTTTTTTAGSTTSTTSTTTTTVAATCYSASNYAHVQAGRAHLVISTGRAAANGSNQDMGLYNTFQMTTLKMTGSNYYVIGTCP